MHRRRPRAMSLVEVSLAAFLAFAVVAALASLTVWLSRAATATVSSLGPRADLARVERQWAADTAAARPCDSRLAGANLYAFTSSQISLWVDTDNDGLADLVSWRVATPSGAPAGTDAVLSRGVVLGDGTCSPAWAASALASTVWSPLVDHVRPGATAFTASRVSATGGTTPITTCAVADPDVTCRASTAALSIAAVSADSSAAVTTRTIPVTLPASGEPR